MHKPSSLSKRFLTVSHKALLLTLVAGALFLGGCASSNKFAASEQIPPGKARVFIYRKSTMLNGAIAFDIFANGAHVLKISNGRYYEQFVDPGDVRYQTKIHHNPLTVGLIHLVAKDPMMDGPMINARSGESYYLVFDAWKQKLLEIDPVTGAQEIQGCSPAPAQDMPGYANDQTR